MARYICDICKVYEYNDELGDKNTNIPKGTKPKDFPDNWKCPVCQAKKDHIVPIKEKTAGPTISEVMVDTFIKWGIDTVFGMVGHSNLGLADAIRKQEEEGKIKFIGIRHECAAAFAASAYGKLTGKPAACMGIAGPGATNLITGMWDAKTDRAPMLALAGQVPTEKLGRGYFQDIDLYSTFTPASNICNNVASNANHAELAAISIKSAIQNKGVSTLIFPNDTQTEVSTSTSFYPEERLKIQDITPTQIQIQKATNLINRAKSPLIIVGCGAKDAMPSIIKLAENNNIPIVTTLKAKGQIADSHKLAGGSVGRSGIPVALNLIEESDLLIVLGASFAEHTGIPENKTIIQVDHDIQILARHSKIKCQVHSEITNFIKQIENKVKTSNQDPVKKIKSEWSKWRKEKRKLENKKNNIHPALIFKHLSKHTPANAIMAIDVGNNTYSFGRYFEAKKQTVTLSGYVGSIGYAFPAAMGAHMAFPKVPIISVGGDGGFAQYMADFTTAVKYDMPIKHILLNNSELGKISLEQRNANLPVWKTKLENPSYAKYAKNCGALGIKVTKKDQLEQAIKKIIKHKGPALLEVITDPNVL